MSQVLHPSWEVFVKAEFEKPYFKELSAFLAQAYQERRIFPRKAQVFRAFESDFNAIKVVILGQDPYHTPGMAHGLAFSVPDKMRVPPSLVNIYKEISTDLGIKTEGRTGDLAKWQKQGVLLLNNVLTVEAHRAGSHRGKGWEIFTEAVIRHLNEERKNLVFLLWGRDAQSKISMIDQKKHLVLVAAHPSPLSARNGFFGCKHFSKTNKYLKAHGLAPIEW